VFWGTALFAIVLTAAYPNPVDPTPSYDDTVSFIWVMVGVATGSRGFCGHPLSTPVPFLGNVRYSFAALGPLQTLARVAVGVAVVLSWRVVAKRVLLLVLPPIYKVLDLPARKFFLSARCVRCRARECGLRTWGLWRLSYSVSVSCYDSASTRARWTCPFASPRPCCTWTRCPPWPVRTNVEVGLAWEHD